MAVLRRRLLASLLLLLAASSSSAHFLNEWAAEIPGGDEEANRVAEELGCNVECERFGISFNCKKRMCLLGEQGNGITINFKLL